MYLYSWETIRKASNLESSKTWNGMNAFKYLVAFTLVLVLVGSVSALLRELDIRVIRTPFKKYSGSLNRLLMSPENESATPWVYDNSPKSAKEKAAFKSQVPFSDDMYEAIKGTIELLNKRLKISTDSHKDPSQLTIDEAAELATKTLTVDEATWLSEAIEVILDDALRYGPPKKL
jgi:hypothetical protein